ncbi:hypothetical protein LCGC14_3054800, partial [marine sediment metagenome]
MRTRAVIVGVMLMAASAAWGIINPNFTPKDLVEQSELVFAGTVSAGANELLWQLMPTRRIKGKPAARHVVSLVRCNPDHVKDIAAAIKANGKDPVILFAGTMKEQKTAYMHMAGMWLNLKVAPANRWEVTGYAPQMSGTLAGGTDMLLRMVEYLAKDEDGDVPSYAAEALGKLPKIIEPLVPVDLVVDHSIQVDSYGEPGSLKKNMEMEFRRNKERYQFLKWGMNAFNTFKVVPPGIGIVHQVNLEYLARGVHEKDGLYYPDTLVGTDSHTTMINGIGVVGWGVGGIEAEAGMLGQPVYFLTPDVVG